MGNSQRSPSFSSSSSDTSRPSSPVLIDPFHPSPVLIIPSPLSPVLIIPSPSSPILVLPASRQESNRSSRPSRTMKP
ncbi:unnamed protein product [Adineta steineri]|uniref:Uncharacterized protein n=1 Tax=Adineta steineri TaxID=433720 RepID=A0A819QTD3_9BILA|nr:unnamed protein product [Adineta steineri]CAF4030490.1 unnamed protein product [Adineta steineri]